MDSSRQTTLGIVLIMAVVMIWMFMNQPKHQPTIVTHVDSTHVATPPAQTPAATTPSAPTETTPQNDTNSAKVSSVFPRATGPSEVRARVETPLVHAEISTLGGSISSWIVKDYKTWNGKPLELVNQQNFQGGDVNLQFVASDGKIVDTKSLAFTLDSANVTLHDGDSAIVKAYCRLDSSRYIEKQFTFNGSKYTVHVEYHLVGLASSLAGFHYSAVVENPLPYQEKDAATESDAAMGFAGMKNGTEEVDVKKPNEPINKSYNGDVDFVASRNQYFVQALLPMAPTPTAAVVTGNASANSDGTTFERYTIGVEMPLLHNNEEIVSATYYLGPLEYKRVEALNVGLENTMNFGWKFLVRWISINLMLPLLLLLHGFISNWGVVIIVFSLLIKLGTIPLSTGQMKSMRKMQVLQPKITELRVKYKEDPKKLNEEMMSVYKTYGVNPAGGCLPTILQMPILFALWAVLRNVIELRQAPFGFWIHDLSVPDGLIQFGTKIPIIGTQLSGLTLLLGATMFIQQIFTVTDPRQKSMAYIMPIVFTFMFNKLPSGVALYYFMFNLFAVGQQFYFRKLAAPLDLEAMKVDPKNQKKGGGLMARLQDMEKNARDVRQQQYTGKKK